jgi:hypothetical protein
MKRTIKFLYFVVPSVLLTIPYVAAFLTDTFAPYITLYIVFVYLITIVGIVLFFIFKFCDLNALLIGLFISPVPSVIFLFMVPFVLDFGDVSGCAAGWHFFGYLLAVAIIFAYVIFYVSPFVIISVVVSAIIRKIGQRKCNIAA